LDRTILDRIKVAKREKKVKMGEPEKTAEAGSAETELETELTKVCVLCTLDGAICIEAESERGERSCGKKKTNAKRRMQR
jgi:hypothetical protein